jgi:hypothetical protein
MAINNEQGPVLLERSNVGIHSPERWASKVWTLEAQLETDFYFKTKIPSPPANWQ